MSRAFDAFVELSGLRDELTLHADARRWRVAARQMIESAVGREEPPSADALSDLADVRGYCLVPALRALPGVMAGRPEPELLAEAATRDELRSTLFIASASVMMARSDVVTGWVARAFSGAPHEPITSGQRALWLAAADGEMAHTVVESVRAELRRRVDTVALDERNRLVADLTLFPPGSPTTATAKSNRTLGVVVLADHRIPRGCPSVRPCRSWAHARRSGPGADDVVVRGGRRCPRCRPIPR